jgi:hypothetical protein
MWPKMEGNFFPLERTIYYNQRAMSRLFLPKMEGSRFRRTGSGGREIGGNKLGKGSGLDFL